MSLLKKLISIITRKNESAYSDIEEFLISNDFGVKYATDFVQLVREKRLDEANIRDFFAAHLRKVFEGMDSSLNVKNTPPNVVLFLGSNGSGKTTTVAKVGNLLKREGKSVLLVAGDTFRAQAAEQLEEWANKLSLPLIKGASGSDPASVVFDGIASARTRGFDIVLIDTSGRVETKENLLKEIANIQRVIEKANGRKPDETLLVLDSYTGLNAISQVEVFSDTVKITGFVLTKFDGGAPAGVIVPIVDKFKIPVKLLGTGEREFDIEYFSVDRYLVKLGY